jgi:uncharacterized protein
MTTPSSTRRFPGRLLFAVLVAGLFGTVAMATDVPFLGGRVNDNAGILSLDTQRELEEVLRTHEDSTSNQIAVLTITSLEGEPLEEYSRRVVMTWKLGQKGKDNGVLLLVAKDDRKVRIEVGRGLEGQLTDAVASSIMRNEILPQFKAGDYDRGVRAGVDAIIGAISGAYTAEEGSDAQMDTGTGILAFLFFLLVVGIFTMVAFATPGCGGWFLYAFLLPFWGVFPPATLGSTVGVPMFGLYAIGMPIAKILLARTAWGKKFTKKFGGSMRSGKGGSGWSNWSSGGSSSSSSSSSFSGGGGSFSGGGSSGSW